MTAEILELLTILLLIKVHKKQQSSFLWIFSLVYERDVDMWVKLAKAPGSFATQLPLFAYGVIDYYWK